MSNLYNPKSASLPSSQQQVIDAAYRLAGISSPPNHLTEVRNLIVDTPTVEQVALDYATQAYETNEPKKLVAEAKKAIEGAMVANTLKTAFLAGQSQTATQMAKRFTPIAAADVTPAFNKDVARLEEAAQALDRDNPLDPEVAVATDTGAALTTVREVLPRLAVYASLYAVPTTVADPNLNKLLAIISLPEIVQEQVKQTVGETVTTINRKETAGTFTVRALAKQAKEDIDLAIVRIARGDFAGVKLELFVKGQSRPRATRIKDAFTRKSVFDTRASFGV